MRTNNTDQIANELTAEFIERRKTTPDLTVAQFFADIGAINIAEKEVNWRETPEPYISAVYRNHFALYSYPEWGDFSINCKYY